MGGKRRRNRPTPLPASSYLAAVAKLADQVKPGTVAHVEVRHDADCDLYNRRGPCNCSPDVALIKPQ
jgi:hypothetical protein